MKALEVLMIMLAVSSPVWLIVLVVHYFKYRAEVARHAADSKQSAEANRDLERQVGELRERVQVLEAIVTDSRFDLNRKIAGL